MVNLSPVTTEACGVWPRRHRMIFSEPEITPASSRRNIRPARSEFQTSGGRRGDIP